MAEGVSDRISMYPKIPLKSGIEGVERRVCVCCVSAVAEGGGGGDYVEERGDPIAQRLPERGPAGEGGSEAGPDAAGRPEAQGAEPQGEGAPQKGEQLNPGQPGATMATMATTPLCPGSGFANRAAVQGGRDQRPEVQTAHFRQKEDGCSAARAQVSYHGYRHSRTWTPPDAAGLSLKPCMTPAAAGSRASGATPSHHWRGTLEQASMSPGSLLEPCLAHMLQRWLQQPPPGPPVIKQFGTGIIMWR